MRAGRVAVWMATGAVASVLYALWKRSSDIYILTLAADALTLPGVIFTGIGGLLRIAESGALDMLGYGVKKLAGVLTKHGRKESYHDYVVNKGYNIRRGTEPLFVGLLYLAAALVICLTCMTA